MSVGLTQPTLDLISAAEASRDAAKSAKEQVATDQSAVDAATATLATGTADSTAAAQKAYTDGTAAMLAVAAELGLPTPVIPPLVSQAATGTTRPGRR